MKFNHAEPNKRIFRELFGEDPEPYKRRAEYFDFCIWWLDFWRGEMRKVKFILKGVER